MKIRTYSYVSAYVRTYIRTYVKTYVQIFNIKKVCPFPVKKISCDIRKLVKIQIR